MDGFENINVNTSGSEEKIIERKPVVDQFGRAYATGKKKSAVARVYLSHGKGDITVNKRTLNDYFPMESLVAIINMPFSLTKTEKMYNVSVTVFGSGLSSQAAALRHGISKALCNMDPSLRPILKSAGFLTRDKRVVERKKYGQKKARKNFQFSKR